MRADCSLRYAICPRGQGEYLLVLRDGSTLISGGTHREAVQNAFGLRTEA